jgi:hypothetical protein
MILGQHLKHIFRLVDLSIKLRNPVMGVFVDGEKLPSPDLTLATGCKHPRLN